MNKNKFKSNYWAHLPDLLAKNNVQINWLHIYQPDKNLSNSNNARNAINGFNKNNDVHTTLDSFICLNTIIKTILDWGKIFFKTYKLKNINSFAPHKFSYCLPLLQDDWSKSCKGIESIMSLFFLNLFEQAFSTLPKQKKGVYLQENQPWEFSLIYIWNKFSNGQLIGVPHSTVRFWDLRYFYDFRSYKEVEKNGIPHPDCEAINGKLMEKLFRDSGYPLKNLFEIEALRYLYIDNMITKQNSLKKGENNPIRILVLGDYLPSKTHKLMTLLENTFSKFKIKTQITVKPHPNCPVNYLSYPNISFVLTSKKISEILHCDVVFTSDLTSAALDVYCVKIPLIILNDCNSLNLSPVRGFKGVKFINNKDELSKAMMNYNEIKINEFSEEIFNTSKKLENWKKLLIDN